MSAGDVATAEQACLWAHSPNRNDDWHSLVDHLEGTGRLAAQFAAPFGGESFAAWLGRSHDLGKACVTWQEALHRVAGTGRPTGVGHKVHAAWAAQRLGDRWAVLMGACALLGHHSGMPDCDSPVAGMLDVARVFRDTTLGGEVEAAARCLEERGFSDILADAARVTLPGWLSMLDDSPEGARRAEMFTRMTFSALVDADFLDTEAHFEGLDGPRVAPPTDFSALFEEFCQNRARLLAGVRESAVVAARESVYGSAVAAAELPPGLFRLPAPTGSGKTLAAGGFALRHAGIHGLRRVVFAVPFTSITTQNAAVYRTVLDRADLPRVLEHHSAVLDGEVGASRWRRLAAANWDAPIVVTTTVQLFESLLSNKPSKARRLHRLARSVIVLDEVQALPLPLLPVLLDVLKALVDDYGATVLLSTATQPEFWALPVWSGFPAASLLPDEGRIRAALRRVNFEWRTQQPVEWPKVAEWLAQEGSALAIVNTTADAQQLHALLEQVAPEGVVVAHLSTRMCGEHRRFALEQVRSRLAGEERVLLVSTQVVEAGVDLDFPVVYRAIAPAESIAQAAGRANREGRLPGGGRVVIFTPAQGGSPGGSYKTATALTVQTFGRAATDPDDPRTLADYFADLYAKQLPGGKSPAAGQIQAHRARLGFASTAEAFRMIEDQGVPVIVDYDDPAGQAAALIRRLAAGGVLDGSEWHFLQSRTATLPHRVAAEAVSAGLAISVRGPDDDAATQPMLLWAGLYHPARGVDAEGKAEPEEVIW